MKSSYKITKHKFDVLVIGAVTCLYAAAFRASDLG